MAVYSPSVHYLCFVITDQESLDIEHKLAVLKNNGAAVLIDVRGRIVNFHMQK